MKVVRTLLVVGLASAGLPLLAGPATAAAQKDTVPLVCDDGHTYTATVNGNGEFSPARDLDTTAVLVPHAFGDFTGEVRALDGSLLYSFTEEGTVKGSGKQKSNIACTFSFYEVSTDGSDPDFPEGAIFSGSGTVIGKFTGR